MNRSNHSQFIDCMQIGRDLLRLLQNVTCIPEFTQLWNEVINQPTALDSTFTGECTYVYYV